MRTARAPVFDHLVDAHSASSRIQSPTRGGDIDNRIKTLLDALKLPAETNALPPGTVPEPGENPFFCLLEDDSLVTRLTIEADQLLEPVTSKSEVVLTIRVRTKALKALVHTLGMT